MAIHSDVAEDFEQWADLAESDPAAFEKLRREAIEAYIASVPEPNRERLRCLQWRIDQERRMARTPLGACIRLSRMMWHTVLGPGGLRDRFLEVSALLNGEEPDAAVKAPSPRVLRFPAPRSG